MRREELVLRVFCLFRTAAFGALLTCLAAPAADAEIYRWQDAGGRMHFTEDLNKVPAKHRPAARAGATPETPRSASPAASANTPPASRASSTRGPGGKRSYRIPVQRAGTHMLVNVRLNNSVTAPFIIDTGASDVVLTQAVANQLGIRVGPNTRTMMYSTANGTIEQAVVMLRTVQLGGAKVEDVPASISDSMSIGLLGLSFFNHFTYQVNAAQGVVTLTPNDLVESGAIRGGRSASQWQASYGNLRARLGMIESERARTPSSRGRKLRDLDAAEKDVQRQLADLDAEADAARVPMAWRD